MGNRRSQRSRYNSYRRRTLAKKARPAEHNGRYTMQPGSIELRHAAKLISYQRIRELRTLCRDSSFAAEQLLENPAMHPKIADTHNHTVPNGWKTVFFSGNARRK